LCKNYFYSYQSQRSPAAGVVGCEDCTKTLALEAVPCDSVELNKTPPRAILALTAELAPVPPFAIDSGADRVVTASVGIVTVPVKVGLAIVALVVFSVDK
jgi:hypothetical protein